MGQKLAKKPKPKKPQLPDHHKKSNYLKVITFRHLGVKDTERRIVTKIKAIPVSATKDQTKAQRFRCKQWDWIKEHFSKLNAHPFFRTKENTYDTLDDEHDEYEIEITESNWNRNIHMHLAIYALVISVSSIFTFPHVCVKYGGAVFFMAYAFVTIFIIQSLIYLEMVVGQFSQRGVSGFGALHVFAKGIPQAIVFMSLVFVPYNFVLQGYTSKYVYGSFYSDPGDCFETWNRLNICVSYKEIQRFQVSPSLGSKQIWFETSTQRTSLISTELYFRQFILHHRWDGGSSEEYSGWNPTLFIGLGFTYVLSFLCTRVRLTSRPSKIVITVAGLLPLLLMGILVSQIFRAGAIPGILKLFFFQIKEWGHLFTLRFWSQVFRSSFLTTGVGCGLYSRISSKNPFNQHSLHRTSWFVILLTLFITLMSTLILMAELGALNHIFNQSSDYETIFAEATGSVFAAISGALRIFDSRAIMCLFFGACNICGIWSEIVATENCTSQVVNWFSIATENVQMARYIALVIVILLQAACATLVSTVSGCFQAGGLMLDSILFDGTWAAAFVSLAEVVSIAYLYGSEFFMIDIELMLRHSAPAMFKLQLRYSSPIALIVIFVIMSYTNIRYGEEKYLGVIAIPDFLVNCGYVFNAIPPLLILILGGFGLFQKPRKGLFWFPAIDYLQRIFTRFTHRRGAIFEAYETEIIDLTADLRRKMRQMEKAQCLEGLRSDMGRIRISQRAQANWLRLANKSLDSIGRVNSFPRVTRWILRELTLKKKRKEVKYIGKVLNTYSLESIFTVPKLVVKKRENDRDRDRLADILLNGLPLDELGFRYANLTLYERLIGKGNPIPVVDKAFLVMRIKRHLDLDCQKDEDRWLHLSRETEEKRKRNSVFTEDPPVEFYFDHDSKTIRAIMFKGKNHSILRNIQHPHPPVIEVAQRHVRQRIGRELWTYLTYIITQEIEKRAVDSVGDNKPVELNGKKITKRNESPRRRKVSPKPLQLFTPFENWYHLCDTRQYNISSSNTFFVAILDRLGFKDLVKDRFSLILPPEDASRQPREVVMYNKPGVYEVTYASLQPFERKISEEEERLKNAPDDSVFITIPRSRSPSSENFLRITPQLRRTSTDTNYSTVNDKWNFEGPLNWSRTSRRFSEIDIHLLRRQNHLVSSAYPPRTRFSDSLILEAKRKADPGFIDQSTDQSQYSDYLFESTVHSKGRRVLEVADSDDDWIDTRLLKTKWRNPDVLLSRTKSELFSEKAMTAWVAEAKGKKKGGLNEGETFFYRRKGKELVVEHREGREETSTSDTAILDKMARGDGRQGGQNRKRRASRSLSTKPRQKVRRRDGTPEAPCRVLRQPLQPAKDSAQYRLLELSNKIKVLLISTPSDSIPDPSWTLKFPECVTNEHDEEEPNFLPPLPTYLPVNYPSLACGDDGGCPSRSLDHDHQPKSCISVTIKAGSFADPPQFQGLAHFVEHIVHHGTESFPGENSYSEFIRKHHGHTNAFTDKTCTNYHAVLSSKEEGIREVCQRYASMLTAPLATVEAVTREIESVDNEYFMRRVCHGFRQNHLLHATTVPDCAHPMRKFSIGSIETLMNPNVANSASCLREASLRFIRTHYFGENMTVVLNAPHPLDFLQECVLESFCRIPAESQYPEDAEDHSEPLPYEMTLFNRFYTAKPSNVAGHTLFIVWALPAEIWKNYKCKTLKYLNCIMGHNAPGGLADHLRNRGLLIQLSIPSIGGIYRNDYTTIFQLEMNLTQLGRNSIDEVLKATFSYLKLHRRRGPQKKIYNQLQQIDKLGLEKFEMQKSYMQIVMLSLNMNEYEDNDILIGDATPAGKFDTTTIKKCLGLLTPSRANYILFTSDFRSTTFETEPIFGTHYTTDEIPTTVLRTLENIDIYDCFELTSSINPHINVTNDNCAVDTDASSSFETFTSDKVKVLSVPTPSMLSEQVNLFVVARFGVLPMEARANSPLFDVWALMLKLESLRHQFQVEFGFRSGIFAHPYSGAMVFNLRGLAGKRIMTSVMELITAFDDFPAKSSSFTFQIAKEAALQYYFNIAANPLLWTLDLSRRLKLPDYMSTVEAYERLKSLTFEDFSMFVTGAKEQIILQCFCDGKIQRIDSIRLYLRLQNIRTRPIGMERYFEIMLASLMVAPKQIPVGETCLRMRAIFQEEKIFSVTNEYEVAGKDEFTSEAVLDVIVQMLSGKIQHQLRTVEQLGYSVGIIRSDCTAFMIFVSAHADKFSPCYIDHRIETFLTEFYNNDFTDDKVSQVIAKNKTLDGISTRKVRKHYQRYLLDATYKRKMSIQIVPPRPVDGTCLCDQGGQQPFPCRRSVWLPPATTIGSEMTEVVYAKGVDCSTSNYFITSVDCYHRRDD